MSTTAELLKKLSVSSESESHLETAEIGRALLKQEYSPEILKQTLVALINLDKYETALSILRKYGGAEDALVERAYVFYKLGLETELLALPQDSVAISHIGAQHFYRVGKNREALQIYRDLIAKDTENPLDLCVNERAVIGQSLLANESLEESVAQTSELSYDLLFNEAVIALGKSDLDSAASLLEEAAEKCSQAMAGAEKEEALAELAPIVIQQAYVKQLEGDIEGALTTLHSIEGVTDSVLKLLFVNNKLALEGEQGKLSGANPNLLYRQLGFPNSIDTATQKLSLLQKQLLLRNDLVLGFLSGKHTPLKSHAAQFPHSVSPEALEASFKAGIAPGITEPHSAAKTLFRKALRSPKAIPLVLAAAQANAAVDNIDNVATILEAAIAADEAVLLGPSVPLVLLAAYDSLHRLTAKRSLLSKVYDTLEMAAIETLEKARYVRHIAFLLISVDEDKAKHLFEKVAQFSEDPLVSAVLDTKAAETLEPLQTLTEGVDVSELVSNGVLPLISNKRPGAVLVKPHKKRTRKNPKHPARVEGVKGPDPERWLPLKDRSYYKKKGKKGAARETQGGNADNTTEESLTPVAKPKQQTQQKKKKVKGRR